MAINYHTLPPISDGGSSSSAPIITNEIENIEICPALVTTIAINEKISGTFENFQKQVINEYIKLIGNVTA